MLNVRRLAFGAAAAAAVCVLAELAAGPGSRLGWWHFRTGFSILRFGAWAGLAAAALSLAAGVLLRGGWAPAAGVLLGLSAFAGPWGLQRAARSFPPIHDITTDVSDPPAFAAVLELRRDAPNPAEYGGPEVAARQRAAYPDLAPLELALAPAETFSRARAAVRELGWTIVAEDPAAGRIEAYDTTFWFGFVDDVAVRVRPSGAGSRVDVRSVSRVGKGDAGANARRIRAFLARLRPA